MKKLLSIILTLVIVMGVFTSVYTPVNAVETSEVTTEPETTEPETTEPETTESVQIVPVMPAGLKAVQAVDGVSLTWDAVEGATSYNIFRKAEGEEEAKLVTTVTESSYVDVNVENGITYEYSVSALNEAGEGDACESVSIKYVAAPELKSASNKTAGVKITWSAVEGSTGYIVYRKTNSSGWKRLAEGLTSTSYVDGTAKSGTTYIYSVKATMGTVVSDFCKEGISVMRLATPDVKGVENAVGGITVKWGKVKGAESYEVYRKVSNGKLKKITTTSKNYYTDENVTNGKTYKYTVKAINGDSQSGYESGMSLKFVATPKMSSVKNTANGLKVSWKSVKGATSYKVYRLETGEKEWDLVGTVKKTTYTDKDVVAYQTYRYSVRAVNGKMSALDKTGLSKKFVPTGKWDKQVTYNFYKNAIDNANETLPKYTLKTWQKVDSSSATGTNRDFVNDFKAVMDSSYYPSSDPLVFKCPKGSEESELLLPTCKAQLKNIKSATAKKSGKNIVVTIVMVDETSPEKKNGGIKAMSGNYFDLNGIVKGFKNEGIITSGSSSSTYKNFTITATIKPDGKIVSMKHSCENIAMSMNMNFINGIGNVKYKAQVDSYLTYTGFKY